MKKLKLFSLAFVVFLSFTYGFISGVYKIFPFQIIKDAREYALGSPPSNVLKNRTSIFLEFSPDSEIAMIGDSITQGGIWSEFFPSHNVVNRGVGGDTAEDIINRFDTIESTKPEISFLMVGINDLHRGASPQEVAEGISVLISKLKDIGSKVVLQTTLECSRDRCGRHLDGVRDLNKILHDLSSELEVEFIDINSALSDDNGLMLEHTYDGIHLNGKGYRAWVDFISSQKLF